jgi:hypothetical protein
VQDTVTLWRRRLVLSTAARTAAKVRGTNPERHILTTEGNRKSAASCDLCWVVAVRPGLPSTEARTGAARVRGVDPSARSEWLSVLRKSSASCGVCREYKSGLAGVAAGLSGRGTDEP